MLRSGECGEIMLSPRAQTSGIHTILRNIGFISIYCSNMSHPVSFKPEIDSHRIEDLRKRLDHACDYAIRYPEPSSPFEMEKSHFGTKPSRLDLRGHNDTFAF